MRLRFVAAVIVALTLVSPVQHAGAQQPSASSLQAARIGMARTARDQGKFAEAANHFRAARLSSTFETPLLVEYFWVAQTADPVTARALGAEILRATPGDAAVREGLIGLFVAAGDENAVRAVAHAGHQLNPTASVWPRRLAESHLRSRDGAAAATYFAKAATLRDGTSADRAMGALALESTPDKAGALQAWDSLGERVWASRRDWADSRARALEATRLPAKPASPDLTRVAAAPIVRKAKDDRCSTASLDALEARADAEALLAAVAARDARCGDRASWTTRAIEAVIGRGRFAEARRLAEPLATTPDAPLALREQYGVLLHWTGNHDRADHVLRAVVAEDPTLVRPTEALVETLRAAGRPDRAWPYAVQWERLGTASAEGRLTIATLALEAGRPNDALTRARALESDAVVGSRARTVAASALLAVGRPSEARTTLRALTPEPAAALAWLEATALVSGAAAALHEATPVATQATAPWADVIAKRAQWHAVVGERAETKRLLNVLAGLDESRTGLANGEIALTLGRPAEATEALRPLLKNPRLEMRARDLLSIALAELGSWDEALTLVTELRQRRPHDASLTLREATWQARRTPSPATLAALQRLVSGMPELGEGAAALARVHMRGGRYAEALAALPERADDSADVRLLRATLLASLGRLEPADAILETLTAGDHADPSWYLAWADLHNSAGGVRRVLNAAIARFPRHAVLQELLAQAAWKAGDRAAAMRAADTAIELDPERTGAWFVTVAAAGQQPGRVEELAQRFEAQFATVPSALLSMGDVLSGLTASGADAAAHRALAWTVRVRSSYPDLQVAAVSTQVRLLMSLDRYAEAATEIDALLARMPAAADARKLRAELHMRTGNYAAAVDAFDQYLAVAPHDLAARRQQARIEGWRGATPAALARYAALHRDAPDAPAIQAEAAAKRAYFEGRWHEAIVHYDAWLALEPGESEARLERAASLDHLGDTRRALQAYQALAAEHDTAAAAADRIRRRRAPSVDLFTLTSSADGVTRRQVLEMIDAGAALSTGLGGYGSRVRFYGGKSFARGDDRDWDGTLAGAELMASASRVDLMANVGYRALNGVTPQWFGDTRITWKPAASVSGSIGFERTSMLENAQTVEAGLVGRGPAAGLRWQPLKAFTADVRASSLSLSDNNTRRVVRLDVAQQLVRRTNELRILASSEHQAFAESRETYFTPGSFWRHDAGLEWRGWLHTPGFFGDREQWISAAYLYGADDRQQRYHTARVGLLYELASGVSVVAGGDVVRSRVYNGTRVTVGLRLKHVPIPVR